jgi:hypothetical protein
VQCGDSAARAAATIRTAVADSDRAPRDVESTYRSESFGSFAMRTIGPIPLLRSAAMAGLDQWRRQPVHWTQTSRGFRDRLDSHLGGEVIGHTIRFAIARAAQEEREKYRPCDCLGFQSRLTHSLLSPFRVETPRGERYSAIGVAGDFASSLAVTSVHPGGFSFSRGVEGGASGIASAALTATVREFWPWHWRPPGM